MNFKTIVQYKEEVHPWEPYVPKEVEILIVGTFPTASENRKLCEFYYPNPQNDFWKILFEIDGKKLCDYQNHPQVEIRKEILTNLKIAICDMGFKVLRQKNSSKDSHLFPLEYTDIFSLLTKFSGIKRIILTSSSGANSVLSWFKDYCELNSFLFEISKEKLPMRSQLFFDNRIIEILVVSSTSKISPIRGAKLFEMYKSAIVNFS